MLQPREARLVLWKDALLSGGGVPISGASSCFSVPCRSNRCLRLTETPATARLPVGKARRQAGRPHNKQQEATGFQGGTFGCRDCFGASRSSRTWRIQMCNYRLTGTTTSMKNTTLLLETRPAPSTQKQLSAAG